MEAGLLVLIGDIGKGVFATLVISRIVTDLSIPLEAVQLIAGCSAVAGHIWSVFAGFRGGKGVGTAAVSFPSIILIMNVSGFRTFSPELRWVSVAIELLLIFTHRKPILETANFTATRGEP